MHITFLGTVNTGGELLPLYSFHVPAGFPSPADDHIERHISLDELLELRAPHTYLVKVEGGHPYSDGSGQGRPPNVAREIQCGGGEDRA